LLLDPVWCILLVPNCTLVIISKLTSAYYNIPREFVENVPVDRARLKRWKLCVLQLTINRSSFPSAKLKFEARQLGGTVAGVPSPPVQNLNRSPAHGLLSATKQTSFRPFSSFLTVGPCFLGLGSFRCQRRPTQPDYKHGSGPRTLPLLPLALAITAGPLSLARNYTYQAG
jgi:hypothetical protein